MSRQKNKLLIVGNGMAAGRLLDEIVKRTPNLFEITVVGDEAHANYNRIMLSPVLAGEMNERAIVQKDREWFVENHIQLKVSARVVYIHRQKRYVELCDGEQLFYDHLVIATGSSPAKIPASNQSLKNIFSFRTLDDVHQIGQAAQGEAVVIGGGLLGLEAAYGLAQQGIDVTLVHRSHWLLNRQLDKNAGALLQQLMESKRIRFALGCEVETFVGEACVTGAKLNTGELIPCRLVVIATGITPNKFLGVECGLETGRGICVDDFMQTSDDNISALGECCEHRGQTFGLVEPIWHQCVTLAEKLCYGNYAPFHNPPVATKLKVSGVNLLSAGEFITRQQHREIVFEDSSSGSYRKLLLENDRIVGVVLFGDTRSGQDYFEFMQQSVDISSIAETLIFGGAYFESKMQTRA